MSGAAPTAAPALVAAAEGCAPRGKLDPIYCNDNGDGIADPPKDTAKLLNPDPLVFAYVPVEDPAVWSPVFADLLRHIEKVAGKKVQYFGPQNYAAQLEAMRSGRLHVTGYSTGSLVWSVNVVGAVDAPPSGFYPLSPWHRVLLAFAIIQLSHGVRHQLVIVEDALLFYRKLNCWRIPHDVKVGKLIIWVYSVPLDGDAEGLEGACLCVHILIRPDSA